MGETTATDESQSFFKRHWNGWKHYWGERLQFLEPYRTILLREEPYPEWTANDVEEFMASDPIYGPQLRAARKAAKVAAVGSLLGSLSLARTCWKYSRSPHGAVLALGAGAAFGWSFGQEFASHWYQLYRMDTMAAQLKFFDWWEKKCQGDANH